MTDLFCVRWLSWGGAWVLPAAAAVGLCGYGAAAGAQEAAVAVGPETETGVARGVVIVDAPARGDAKFVPKFVLEAGTLLVVQGAERVAVALPGRVVGMRLQGERAFVALGAHGAAVVSLSKTNPESSAAAGVPHVAAQVEKMIPVSHGEVTGFMVSGDQLWMQVSSRSAILVDGTSGAAPLTPVTGMPAAGTHATTATHAEVAREPESVVSGLEIVKVFNGQVLLNRGTAAGLRVGQHIKVVRSERLEDEGGSFAGEHAVATLIVEHINNDTARAGIWRGDEVVMGDSLVVATRDYDPSLMFPRQLHGFVEAEMHVRPLLNVGAAGFGVLMDDHITYVAKDYYVGLRNEPLALGRSEGSSAFTQTTLLEGGYNSRPFSIGLAAGFTSVYGDLREMFEFTSYDSLASNERGQLAPGQPEYTAWTQDMQHAFALGQRVRLGAMDGLNLAISNTLLFFPGGADGEDEDKGGFIWGGSTAKLSIPLAQNADLFFEGGGGIMGYSYGAVGVFGWISGNGGPGSLGLMASAGGAGIWGTRTRRNNRWGQVDREHTRVAGPMVSLGLRYRAGLGGK